MDRGHLVLVPGFVGFDVLGQLSYYAGVTGAFARWRAENRADHLVLHYFDSVPTASVAVRAELLVRWLAKRIARGEIDGRVVLIGHSTGGLDIRRALVDLAVDRSVEVDGVEISTERIRAHLREVVFLSVPHYGTNLASFALRFAPSLQAAAGRAAHAVWLNRSAVASLRRWLLGGWTESPSHIALAILDALDETDEYGDASPLELANSRTARAELAGWLDQVSKDFSILADLRSGHVEPADPWTPEGRNASPAHFSGTHRRRELAEWRKMGLQTRSYATWVPPDRFREDPGARAFVDAVFRAEAGSLTASARLLPAYYSLRRARRDPGLLFSLFYRACADARGPFHRPPVLAPLSRLDGRPAFPLTPEDNDGVVNTLSMVWPYDDEDPHRHVHLLVEADHGDIVGHYALRAVGEPVRAGRRHVAYDFFQGARLVDDDAFRAIWDDLFTSAA